MSDVIRIVSATRVPADEFETGTLLGRSLARLRPITPVETEIAFNNTDGLPAIYNRAIDRAKGDPAILVFVHDDVYIADVLWVEEIRRCLNVAHVLGLAGNKRRVANQPGWAFVPIGDGKADWDQPEYLSGVVGHGEPPGELSLYGPVHHECKLLDGLMLVADSKTLNDRDVAFDPRFSFHFYDMDFCRQAELKQLRMATAAIKVVHRSGGAFGGEPWQAAYKLYLQKYGG